MSFESLEFGPDVYDWAHHAVCDDILPRRGQWVYRGYGAFGGDIWEGGRGAPVLPS